MLKTIIRIDGKYYAGEASETYHTDTGTDGWYTLNKCELNKLAFADSIGGAKLITSVRGLKSELERIMTRVYDDVMDFGVIEIVKCECSE